MSRRIQYLVLAVVIAGFAPAGAYAGEFLTATGNEVLQGVLDPGHARCAGGELAAGFPPCSPGTNQILIRGWVMQFVYVNLAGKAAWMFDGVNTIVMNCNLDANLEGHCWGTFRWVIGDAGVWEGTWGGTFNLAIGSSSYAAVGHGSGNGLEGFTAHYDAVGNQGVTTFTARVTPPQHD